MLTISDRLQLVRFLQASEADLVVRYRMCQAMGMTPEEEGEALISVRRALDPSIAEALSLNPLQQGYLKNLVMLPAGDAILGYMVALDLTPTAFVYWQNSMWRELMTPQAPVRAVAKAKKGPCPACKGTGKGKINTSAPENEPCDHCINGSGEVYL